jgi:hypothetical protein
MPTLPWTAPNPAPPGVEVHAFTSRFEPGVARGAQGLRDLPLDWDDAIRLT